MTVTALPRHEELANSLTHGLGAVLACAAAAAAQPLMARLPPAGLAWMVAGGLAYTVGAIFYALKRLPFAHTVWHLFVLGGSACHFLTVLLYVVPPG